MLTELQPAEYQRVHDLFAGFTHSISIWAVLAGNSNGRVFVDDRERPNVAFAMTIEGYLLAGDPDNAAARKKLTAFFKEQIFTGKIYLDDDSNMTLGVDPIGWEAQLPTLIPTHEVEKLNRFRHLCTEVGFDWRAKLPAGYSMRLVDKALMTEQGVTIDPLVRDWGFVMDGWGSLDKFLAHGGGVAVLHDETNQVVGWSLADCYHGEQIDVGIVIAPDHRQLGLAACTVAAMVESCFERGFKRVGWHSMDLNVGSWKTAEKVGFRKVADYNYYYYTADVN